MLGYSRMKEAEIREGIRRLGGSDQHPLTVVALKPIGAATVRERFRSSLYAFWRSQSLKASRYRMIPLREYRR